MTDDTKPPKEVAAKAQRVAKLLTQPQCEFICGDLFITTQAQARVANRLRVIGLGGMWPSPSRRIILSPLGSKVRRLILASRRKIWSSPRSPHEHGASSA